MLKFLLIKIKAKLLFNVSVKIIDFPFTPYINTFYWNGINTFYVWVKSNSERQLMYDISVQLGIKDVKIIQAKGILDVPITSGTEIIDEDK